MHPTPLGLCGWGPWHSSSGRLHGTLPQGRGHPSGASLHGHARWHVACILPSMLLPAPPTNSHSYLWRPVAHVLFAGSITRAASRLRSNSAALFLWWGGGQVEGRRHACRQTGACCGGCSGVWGQHWKNPPTLQRSGQGAGLCVCMGSSGHGSHLFLVWQQESALHVAGKGISGMVVQATLGGTPST